MEKLGKGRQKKEKESYTFTATINEEIKQNVGLERERELNAGE